MTGSQESEFERERPVSSPGSETAASHSPPPTSHSARCAEGGWWGEPPVFSSVRETRLFHTLPARYLATRWPECHTTWVVIVLWVHCIYCIIICWIRCSLSGDFYSVSFSLFCQFWNKLESNTVIQQSFLDLDTVVKIVIFRSSVLWL